MKIIHAYPPNIDVIEAAFHVRRIKGVIFTYGDTIYVPDGGSVSPELRAHEGVHFSQQTADPEKIRAWWDQYIADPEFRYHQEAPAHRAEYRTYCSLHRDYNQRARFLHEIANRLAGPLYGGLVKPSEARRFIAGTR